jgi:hypothetical protein
MTQPLIVTFTFEQPADILHRGTLYNDVLKASQAFTETTKAHKPVVATSEGVPEPAKKTRKARTRPPVAETPNGAGAGQGLASDGAV